MPPVSLLDDLVALKTPPSHPCRYARLADVLTSEEWEAVEALAELIATGTAPGRTGWKTLADKLTANGHRITDQTIRKHVDQGCTCGPAR